MKTLGELSDLTEDEGNSKNRVIYDIVIMHIEMFCVDIRIACIHNRWAIIING